MQTSNGTKVKSSIQVCPCFWMLRSAALLCAMREILAAGEHELFSSWPADSLSFLC